LIVACFCFCVDDVVPSSEVGVGGVGVLAGDDNERDYHYTEVNNI
jgi:hypothetical protein